MKKPSISKSNAKILRLCSIVLFAVIISSCSEENPENGDFASSSTGSISINGHQGVLMRRATEDTPALYVATCNIGATIPEEAGYYFWWGDTKGQNAKGYQTPKSVFTYDKSIDELYKKGYLTTNDVSTAELNPEYDAAQVQWGGDWRIPSKEDLIWLKDNCIWMWQSSRAGKLAGYNIRSKKTNNTVFIPSAGIGSNNRIEYVGDDLYLWSSTPFDKPKESWTLFKTDLNFKIETLLRDRGMQIRPVVSF